MRLTRCGIIHRACVKCCCHGTSWSPINWMCHLAGTPYVVCFGVCWRTPVQSSRPRAFLIVVLLFSFGSTLAWGQGRLFTLRWSCFAASTFTWYTFVFFDLRRGWSISAWLHAPWVFEWNFSLIFQGETVCM